MHSPTSSSSSPSSAFNFTRMFTSSLCIVVFITIIVISIISSQPATTHALIVNCNTGQSDLAPCIAIDFGNSFSSVAFSRRGETVVIPDLLKNEHNTTNRTRIPSIVAFHRRGSSPPELVAGETEEEIALVPTDDEEIHEVTVFKDLKTKLAYRLKQPRSNENQAENDHDVPSIEQVVAALFKKLKQMAEEYLHADSTMKTPPSSSIDQDPACEAVRNVILTIPSYFNDAHRPVLKDAAALAGLNVVRFIMEPTAIALAHGLDKIRPESNIIILDMSETHVDVTLIVLDDGFFETMATAREPYFGGHNVSENVCEVILTKLKNRDYVDLAKLDIVAEDAKRQLSDHMTATITLNSENITVTREEFDKYCLQTADLEEFVLPLLDSVLRDAKMKKTDIHDLVFAGGSSRIPKLQQTIRNYFSQNETESDKNNNSETASLHTMTITFHNSSTLLSTQQLNEDHTVALGGAIQAAVICNQLHPSAQRCYIPMEFIPMSLGIRVNSTRMMRIVERNTWMPTMKSCFFKPARANQTQVEIDVLEGESAVAKNNNLIGKFTVDLTTVSSADREFSIVFHVDENEDLTITIEADDAAESDEDERSPSSPPSHDQPRRKVLLTASLGSIFRNRTTDQIDEIMRRNISDEDERIRIIRQNMSEVEDEKYLHDDDDINGIVVSDESNCGFHGRLTKEQIDQLVREAEASAEADKLLRVARESLEKELYTLKGMIQDPILMGDMQVSNRQLDAVSRVINEFIERIERDSYELTAEKCEAMKKEFLGIEDVAELLNRLEE